MFLRLHPLLNANANDDKQHTGSKICLKNLSKITINGGKVDKISFFKRMTQDHNVGWYFCLNFFNQECSVIYFSNFHTFSSVPENDPREFFDNLSTNCSAAVPSASTLTHAPCQYPQKYFLYTLNFCSCYQKLFNFWGQQENISLSGRKRNASKILHRRKR